MKQFILSIACLTKDGISLSCVIYSNPKSAARNIVSISTDENITEFKSTLVCSDGKQYHWNSDTEGACPYYNIH